MLSSTSLTEEGVEGIIATANGFVTWHLAIGLDAMLKTEKLPACIANLDATLSEVQAKDLTHCVNENLRGVRERKFRRSARNEAAGCLSRDVTDGIAGLSHITMTRPAWTS
jgi:hypothetical protein